MGFVKYIKEDEFLPDVIHVSHSTFRDPRGSIWTSFDVDLASKIKQFTDHTFSHDKFAMNGKNVLRGIHGDDKSWKLVTVVNGCAFQVVVDCRKSSESFLRYTGFYLDSNRPTSVLVPPGYGNAFLSLKEETVYHYKLAYPGEYNDASNQFTYKWNDSRIGVKWPTSNPILSERDA